jgi:hypothetical protein
MNQYPCPLPPVLLEAIKEMELPAAVSILVPKKDARSLLPMIVLLYDPASAERWSHTSGLVIRCSILEYLSGYGAIMALELEVSSRFELESLWAYTFLNPDNNLDEDILDLLTRTDSLLIGFGGTDGLLQGVTPLSWTPNNRAAIGAFLIRARKFNMETRRFSRLDYNKAKEEFHVLYEKQQTRVVA